MDTAVSFLKRFMPVTFKDKIKSRLAGSILGFDRALPSFSHCGEDRILAYLFKKFPAGFFVDVGAFHPRTSSNTFLLYQRGWRGINIDAQPGSMEPFRRERPDDINLELAVAEKEESLTYYKTGHTGTSSDLRLNPHLHTVALDGAWHEQGNELVARGQAARSLRALDI